MSQAVGSNTAGYSDNLSSVNSNPSYHSIESITPYVPFSLTGHVGAGKKSQKGTKGKTKKGRKNRCPARCQCESCVCEVICRTRKKTKTPKKKKKKKKTQKKKTARMMGTIMKNLPTRKEFGYILANLGLAFGTPTVKLLTSAVMTFYENRADISRKVVYVFDRLTKGETKALMRLKESEFRDILEATNQKIKEKHMLMLSETMIDALIGEFQARLVHERRAHTAVPNADSEFEDFMDVVPVKGHLNMSQEGDKLKERYEKEREKDNEADNLIMEMGDAAIAPGKVDSPWNLVDMAGKNPKKGSVVSFTEELKSTEDSGENEDSGKYGTPTQGPGPNAKTGETQRKNLGELTFEPGPDSPSIEHQDISGSSDFVSPLEEPPQGPPLEPPQGGKPPLGPRHGAGHRRQTKAKSQRKGKKARSRRYR